MVDADISISNRYLESVPSHVQGLEMITFIIYNISNQVQISLELDIDISNTVIGLSNTDICNKRVLSQLIYLRERERERERERD